MKKKEAVQTSINEFEDATRREQNQIEYERQQRERELPKPSLLKRVGAGLLDFVIAAAFAAGLFAIAYFSIFPEVGYQQASETINNTYVDSGLYVVNGNSVGLITYYYDNEKTPEENYDTPITNFYSTNQRAIDDHKLESYNQSKLDSGLYKLDGDIIVRMASTSEEKAKAFLEAKYQEAINYLFDDPILIDAYNVAYNTMFISLLSIAAISCGILYFLVPLLDTDRRTIGYIACNIVVVNSEDLTTPKRLTIALRSLMFVTFTYFATVCIYMTFGTAALLPFLINSGILCFSRTNSGLHDYACKTVVINRSRSDAFAILDTIKEIKENEYSSNE